MAGIKCIFLRYMIFYAAYHFIFIFLAALRGMRDLSSPTRG